MHTGFWFNRIIEYWTLPTPDAVLDHVRRGKVQVVQVGNFGVDFYGLADDPDVVRQFPGMPAVGIEENLELAADLVPQIQQAGARVVGQFSMSWHNADHETGKGLFGSWERIWTPDLLGGEAPRVWLSAGEHVGIFGAPVAGGRLDMAIDSSAASHRANITLPPGHVTAGWGNDVSLTNASAAQKIV